MRTYMKINICQRCILPETFPGVTFDDHGVCNYCLRDESALAKASEKKGKYRERLDQLIEGVKRLSLIHI